MSDARVLSADSHVIEPPDLWTTRIDRRFRDRAPHVEHEYAGIRGDWFVCEGVRPLPISAFAVAGVDPREFGAKMLRGYEGVRPSGWDPVERIKDQEVDGVAGEVLYTSFGMSLYGIKDGELRAASFRAYNDWLAEYCAHDRRRLAGVGLVPMDEVGDAVREVERCARLGLAGGLIWGSPPAARPYDRPEWDPLWAAAQDAGLPLSLHILTGAEGSGLEGASLMKTYPSLPHRMERSISDLVLGGALQRFPLLRIVSAENDIGWIAHFLQRLDHSWERYRHLERGPAIRELPSAYFRRQVFATFQEDRVGILTREFVGSDRLMWASDFPHSDSTWPHSRDVIARDFAGVPAAEVRRITADNCAELYRLG
jgi:predicted TIM-barrel fold metal-dependent hydrolase